MTYCFRNKYYKKLLFVSTVVGCGDNNLDKIVFGDCPMPHLNVFLRQNAFVSAKLSVVYVARSQAEYFFNLLKTS